MLRLRAYLQIVEQAVVGNHVNSVIIMNKEFRDMLINEQRPQDNIQRHPDGTLTVFGLRTIIDVNQIEPFKFERIN